MNNTSDNGQGENYGGWEGTAKPTNFDQVLEVQNSDTSGEVIINTVKRKIHKPSYKTELAKMRRSRNVWRMLCFISYAALVIATISLILEKL